MKDEHTGVNSLRLCCYLLGQLISPLPVAGERGDSCWSSGTMILCGEEWGAVHQPALDRNVESSSMVNGWKSRVCTCGGWHELTGGGEWSWMFSSHKEVDEPLSLFPSKEGRGSGKLHNQSVAEQHYNPEFLTTKPVPRLRVSAWAPRLPVRTCWREVISFTLVFVLPKYLLRQTHDMDHLGN